ncbi:MAG: hypothetical protein IT160_20615, partial [Bryobacterales bacterium]|nr:hypothetical protein [Bryobacterales bacterium]
MDRAKTQLLFTAFLISAGLLPAQSVGIPKVSYHAAHRFLEQASWGPDAVSIAHVQSVGFATYINEQLSVAPTPIPAVPPNSKGRAPLITMQQQFFANALSGGDQLRQRVAFALSQIWVVSGLK